MTEIKLTKRYPLSRTEDITDAYMRGWNDALDAVQNGKFHIAEQTEPTTEDCSMVESVTTDTSYEVLDCWQTTKKPEKTSADCPWK